jgi:hypothetical protein
MNKLLLAASLSLTGCAGFGDITPEQAAVLINMQRSQAQQVYVQPPIYAAPRPLYVAPQPVYVAPRQSINCVTTNGGYSLYTTCR